MKKMTKTAAVALVAIATSLAMPFSASALRSDDDSAKWGMLRDKDARNYVAATDDSPRWGALLTEDGRKVTRNDFNGPRWTAAEGRYGKDYIPAVDGRPRWGALRDQEVAATKTVKAATVVEDEGTDEADK